MSLEIATDQGIFGIDLQEDLALAPHFYIKCGCGGKGGKYSGARIKGTDRVTAPQRFECSFYMCVHNFLDLIGEGQNKLIIVCNDCEREFLFTDRSYRELIKKISQASAEASGRRT